MYNIPEKYFFLTPEEIEEVKKNANIEEIAEENKEEALFFLIENENLKKRRKLWQKESPWFLK